MLVSQLPQFLFTATLFRWNLPFSLPCYTGSVPIIKQCAYLFSLGFLGVLHILHFFCQFHCQRVGVLWRSLICWLYVVRRLCALQKSAGGRPLNTSLTATDTATQQTSVTSPEPSFVMLRKLVEETDSKFIVTHEEVSGLLRVDTGSPSATHRCCTN